MIVFACIAPHPPLLLPSVGSEAERGQVKHTIDSLHALGKKLSLANPATIVVSAPHPDWGFNVPLHFLAQGLASTPIETFLTDGSSPKDHFEAGKEFFLRKLAPANKKIALVASGDLSHRLKTDGPYGYHEQGPQFDKALIDSLKKKDVEAIVQLDERFPEAGECGLRSFCFALGILDAAKAAWKANILSYEGPFGVGYLVADFSLNP